MKTIARGYYDAVGQKHGKILICEDASLAVQASKDETDINTIIRKYLQNGEKPETRQGVYADISQLSDLKQSIEQAYAAQEAFEQLPADVRRYFDNDPVKLVEFAQDASNQDKAIELGLATKRPTPPSPAALAAGQADPVPPQASPKGEA